MSYSTLIGFRENGDAYTIREFKNSHYIPVIWDALEHKYHVLSQQVANIIGCRDVNSMTYEVFDEIRREAKYRLMQDHTPTWELRNNESVSDDDWYCLVFTFDNVIVPPELIPTVAAAFENFSVPVGKIDHGHGFAQAMKKELEEEKGLRGIALHSTSVLESPWRVRDGDEYRAYNLDRDSKHWFMSKREDWEVG